MVLGYLDPGTGSLLLQAVVGGLAGIGVAYKAWRSKLSRKVDTGATVDGVSEVSEETAPTEP
jgi:hypothetical protein